MGRRWLPERWVNPQGWGQPPPVQPPPVQPPPWGPIHRAEGQSGPPPEAGPSRPEPLWRRKDLRLAAGVVGGLALIGALLTGVDRLSGSGAARTTVQGTAPVATPPSPSTSSLTTSPETTAPPTTIPQVTVPLVVGLDARTARNILVGRGLRANVTFKTTAQFPAGTVISQSGKPGSSVRAGSVVTLVIAKAP
jgi:hypothetical protein